MVDQDFQNLADYVSTAISNFFKKYYKPVLKREGYWKTNIAEKGFYSVNGRHGNRKCKL